MGSGESDVRYLDRERKVKVTTKKPCTHGEASLRLGIGALCHLCGQWALWDKVDSKK